MSMQNSDDRSRMKVARLALSAAQELIERRDELTFGEGQGEQRHREYHGLAQATRLASNKKTEGNHGSISWMLVKTPLGNEHQKMLDDMEDLARRLESFAKRVLLQDE